jgi:hypothetical protein
VHLRFSEYFQQEAVGTRMRWWDRSLRDFLLPYLRSAIGWVTGMEIISDEVQRRNSDTLTDMLNTPGVSPDRLAILVASHGKELPPSSVLAIL